MVGLRASGAPRWRGALVGLALMGLLLSTVAALAQGDEEPEVLPPVAPELLQGPGQKAAEAFAQGDAAEAARRYKVLLDTRGPTPALLYNLGTAWAFADEPGRALWALERARLRSPRDEAIEHNLEVLRQRVRVARVAQRTRGRLTDGVPEGVGARRTLTAFTFAEVLWPMLLCNAALFVLLGMRRRTGRGGLRDGLTVGAGLAGLLVAGLLSAAIAREVALQTIDVGVVLDARVTLSETPTASTAARAHADLYRGATVRVLERRQDGWTRLQLVDGTQGWVEAGHVGLID